MADRSYTKTAGDAVVRDDGLIIPADPDNRDRQDYDAWVKAGGVPISFVPPVTVPVLTGASLLDVLSDAEIGVAGIKPRDLYRLAARANDVVPPGNPKVARILAKASSVTPGLTYDALLARLPGAA